MAKMAPQDHSILNRAVNMGDRAEGAEILSICVLPL